MKHPGVDAIDRRVKVFWPGKFILTPIWAM